MNRWLTFLAATLVTVGCTGSKPPTNPVAPNPVPDGSGGSVVIQGTVSEMVDGVRQPSVAASVDAYRESTHRLANSDADGKFSIDGLAPGIWTLAVTKDGFVPSVTQLEVTDNMPDIAVELVVDPSGSKPRPEPQLVRSRR